MKHSLIPSFLFALLFVVGCDTDRGPRVSGSGNVISESRTLDTFDRIRVKGSTNVVLQQGATPSLVVEADDNIVPIITTEVRSGELVVSSSQNYRTRNPVTVYVTTPALQAVRVEGSADVVSTTALEGEALAVEVSGSGNVELEVYYNELTVDISGSGDVDVSGEVTTQDISVVGSGNYRARNLPSVDCFIDVAGSGDGQVRVSRLLEVKVTGSGDVIYYGDPEIRSTVSGSGDLKKG